MFDGGHDISPAAPYERSLSVMTLRHFLDQPQAQREPKYSQTERAMICGGKRWFL